MYDRFVKFMEELIYRGVINIYKVSVFNINFIAILLGCQRPKLIRLAYSFNPRSSVCKRTEEVNDYVRSKH